MTVVIIQDSHKEDLKLLLSQPLNILVDFCKLASNFISKGCNMKLYNAAAQKLQVDVKQIQTVVEGLAYLFIEAAKHNLNQNEFKQTVLNLNLPETFFDSLFEEYLGMKDTLVNSLSETGIQHYQFKNLEWRFETQVSSRAMTKQVEPRVFMQLELEKRGETKRICVHTDIPNVVYMSQQINQALQDSKTNHSKRIQRAII